MATTVKREIVKIDEDKCNGCGLCVPSCAEGAIQIIDGKARLVGENLCDGLGACLGECPQDAITIEERPAEAFDSDAVEEHLKEQGEQESPEPHADHACPGAMLRTLKKHSGPATDAGEGGVRVSQLGQWPVQLALLPPKSDIWRGADVLVAADCVPVALAGFHERLLKGKTLAIACPKLDDVQPYIEKLTTIFADNDIHSVTVVHMEVPCCGALVGVVRTALEKSQRTDIELKCIVIGIDGEIKND